MTKQPSTLAESLRADAEALRKRFVHATRPKGPLSLAEAMDLCSRMDGDEMPAESVPIPHLEMRPRRDKEGGK